MKVISKLLFKIALNESKSKHFTSKEIEDKCDETYGKLLSKFINDKKLNDIQLTKRNYNHDYNKN